MTSNQPACSSTHLLSGFDWFKDRRTRTDNHIKIGEKKEAPFYFAQVDWPPTHFRYTQSHTVTQHNACVINILLLLLLSLLLPGMFHCSCRFQITSLGGLKC